MCQYTMSLELLQGNCEVCCYDYQKKKQWKRKALHIHHSNPVININTQYKSGGCRLFHSITIEGKTLLPSFKIAVNHFT